MNDTQFINQMPTNQCTLAIRHFAAYVAREAPPIICRNKHEEAVASRRSAAAATQLGLSPVTVTKLILGQCFRKKSKKTRNLPNIWGAAPEPLLTLVTPFIDIRPVKYVP